MRIIVTGGAGFIGSALCRRLMAQPNNQVLNIDKLTYAANLASLAPIQDHRDYHLLQADVCDLALMTDTIASFRPEAVMHLAAESHVDRSITGSAEFIRTNINGTHSMLEASRAYWGQLPSAQKDAFRFLHVSTDEVFGSLGPEGLFHEGTPYDPRSPYSASKASSDHLVRAWHYTYGMPTFISNCSNNYGPYHFPEKLIPLIILNALEGRPLPVYGNGSNIRDWLYVDDHAGALQRVVERGIPGESYNIGGRNERTNLDVVHTICDILDQYGLLASGQPRRELVTYVADRPGHDQRYAIDCSKIEAELGWRAQETFETGIARTIAWYLENTAWWHPIWTKKYSGERLGLKP